MVNSFIVLRDIIENNGCMIDELVSKFGCLDVQELKHSYLIEEKQGLVTVTEEGLNKMMPLESIMQLSWLQVWVLVLCHIHTTHQKV